MAKFYIIWWFFVALFNFNILAEENSLDLDTENENANANESDAEHDDFDLDKEQDPEIEYQKGSLCGYCSYCKFCKLCDRDCPCQKSPTKPNCHLCKYCKYCYLCKIACDTFCQPGGIVDRFTSSLFSKLPYYDKEEINNDIDKVKDWIEKNKDEL